MSNDRIIEKLNTWIGDSEESNWTAYSPELVAKTILPDFTEDQWEMLKKVVLLKPEYWQQRCAVSLGEDRSGKAIEILKLLFSESQHLDVQVMAIYELDWAEVPIEHQYAAYIKEVIANIPEDEVEPELQRLFSKAESAKI
ncbi:conserved hypothetical protein [Pseudomonas sp. 8BK]|uniref:HEAT repeat domain-containing protein n=1 Tax=Pseudomonas sp. 8BK TaxID=2653164 RepID=UPI0012EEEC1E|nr:HEAT repeat domain-containing protein [Pseudomonas sp. 8BK]VXB51640.1 conserved hypothetical protein [Pseudomonas sp. 8BK]